MAGLSLEHPEADELRVDLFGPGVGECAVVHIGEGRWIIIDSCAARGESTPAAIRYLTDLGADLDGVDFIVASHWHDDHIKGIAKVLEQCQSAKFVVSNAIRPDEFLAATQETPAVASRFSSGAAELSRVEAILQTRGDVLIPANVGQRLLHRPGGIVSEVWTLSPSAVDVDLSRRHVRHQLEGLRPGRRRMHALEPNDTTVVLQLETIAGPLVFGGDLEHEPSVGRERGWHAVMDTQAAPQGRAALLKVPHHGSENAHCPEVWEHRVENDVLALVAPFDRGKTSLPRPSDRDRLRGLTSRGYLTSDKRARPVPRDRPTVRTLRENVRAFKPKTLLMGHVQATFVDGEWSVGLSAEAVAI